MSMTRILVCLPYKRKFLNVTVPVLPYMRRKHSRGANRNDQIRTIRYLIPLVGTVFNLNLFCSLIDQFLLLNTLGLNLFSKNSFSIHKHYPGHSVTTLLGFLK